MRGKRDKGGKGGEILIRKEEVVEGEAHGGSWKVAYADFVTAMMAFFLLMWVLNATTEDQRKGLADYFSPNSVLSHASSGTGQPFGGKTAFATGAMVSDLGAAQVVVGQRPVVDQADDDGSDVIAQPRPHRDDPKSTERDLGGRPPPGTARGTAESTGAGATPKPVAATAAAAAATQRPPSEAELQAELAKREKQAFDQATQEIREAVSGDPQLAELAKQLMVDMTPEGLRIQLVDADREAMFAFGSAIPNDHARLPLQKIAPILARMTESISIAGHTDAAPFPGPDRTNWELSADRANATRRLLVDAGLQEARIRSVTGNAARDPLIPSDPLAAANRRIAIVVLRSVQPGATSGQSVTARPAGPP
jgi:chemotaxis protein MotB